MFSIRKYIVLGLALCSFAVQGSSGPTTGTQKSLLEKLADESRAETAGSTNKTETATKKTGKKVVQSWSSYLRPCSRLYGTLGLVGSSVAATALLVNSHKRLHSSMPSNHVVSLLPIGGLYGISYLMDKDESSEDIAERSKREPTLWEKILPSRKNISTASALVAAGLSFFWSAILMRPDIIDGSSSEEFETPKASFKDIAGGVPEDFEKLRHTIENAAKYDEMNVPMPKGYLLHGPSGTGKTALARALAGEAGIPFIAKRGSDFVNTYVGTGPAAIRKLFQSAREAAAGSLSGKAIIFIDEIDTIGGKRDARGSHQSERETLNALLTEMDGFDDQNNIFVLAATNRPESLDTALVREGRFDKKIFVGLPSVDGVKSIFEYYLGKIKKKNIDATGLDGFANTMLGWSGARIKAATYDAARNAVYNGDDQLTNMHLAAAIQAYNAPSPGMPRLKRTTSAGSLLGKK